MTSIDFDAASAAWMANKIRRGPALMYKCTAIQKNGSTCTRAAKSECVPYKPHLCTQHAKTWSVPSASVPSASVPSPSSVPSASSASPSPLPPCLVIEEIGVVEIKEEIKPKKRNPVLLQRNLRKVLTAHSPSKRVRPGTVARSSDKA